MNERFQNEQAYRQAQAQELREKFQSGMLAELVEYPHFVTWRSVPDRNKPRKPPFDCRTHKMADTTDPRTWVSLPEALTGLESGFYQGIGFVLAEDDPFSVVDIDHSVGSNRSIDFWARRIIAHLNSYTEYSPTDGIHILTRATVPEGGRRTEGIEMYSKDRYITLTLNHVRGTPQTIQPRQEEQMALYRLITLPQRDTPPVFSGATMPVEEATDAELIESLRQEEHSRFKSFYAGKQWLWQGKYKVYNSKSEADFAFIMLLLEKTGENVEQVKRIFQSSGRKDDKTDSRRGQETYISLTIRNALRVRRKQKR